MSDKVKAAEATWITDRLPTKDDASLGYRVWVTRSNALGQLRTWLEDYSTVEPGTPWQPITKPEPYQQPTPEPDASLEASIAVLQNSVIVADLVQHEIDAIDRIIAAARKVEELEQTIGEMEQSYQELESERNEINRNAEKLEKRLHESNDLLRSAFQIADRCGVETAWEAFAKRLSTELEVQHKIMYPDAQPDKPTVPSIRVGIDPVAEAVANAMKEAPVKVAEHFSTDPDGVGEGWRLLQIGELRPYGYQFDYFDGKWMDGVASFVGHAVTGSDFQIHRYRRRIEQAEAPPDPGEGWELCSAEKGSQNWNSVAGKWMDGKHYGGWNRRRVETVPVVASEQPAKVRREFWIGCNVGGLGHAEIEYSPRPGFIHVREVIEGDPDPAWTEELIRLCIDLCKYPLNSDTHRWTIGDISRHLAKRDKQ